MIRKPAIIVCGDIMVDHNIYTTTARIAVEAPIPIFKIQRDEYSLGGCGNVLKNLHALGCSSLHIFGSVGDDPNGRRIREAVDGMNIHSHIKTVNGATITKQRYFCDNRVVFRCDDEDDAERYEWSCVDDIENILKNEKIDCIIMSDYNKGFLNKEHCRRIIELANRHGVFTSVDPKKDYSKYIGCSLIKPNRKEACELFHHTGGDINSLHVKIIDMIKCKYSVVTLAEKGITLSDGTSILHEHVPEPLNIIDVTGAGDIVCAILSYYIPLDVPIDNVLRRAAQIATHSVECVGTYTIHPEDIV
jgi:D-beta-D-heptose 7-phosphate kinase/D-beta-D-heptose 1-phosphate adenosyltransferase